MGEGRVRSIAEGGERRDEEGGGGGRRFGRCALPIRSAEDSTETNQRPPAFFLPPPAPPLHELMWRTVFYIYLFIIFIYLFTINRILFFNGYNITIHHVSEGSRPSNKRLSEFGSVP